MHTFSAKVWNPNQKHVSACAFVPLCFIVSCHVMWGHMAQTWITCTGIPSSAAIHCLQYSQSQLQSTSDQAKTCFENRRNCSLWLLLTDEPFVMCSSICNVGTSLADWVSHIGTPANTCWYMTLVGAPHYNSRDLWMTATSVFQVYKHCLAKKRCTWTYTEVVLQKALNLAVRWWPIARYQG